MRSAKIEFWVVYRMELRGKKDPVSAVCEQSEWDEMERSDPGRHLLVKRDIESEGEAERLARGKSGDPPTRRSLPR